MKGVKHYFGGHVNAWMREWEASKELRFQYPNWTDYAFKKRLKEVWDGSADLQRDYADDFGAFKTATKKQASDALQAQRDKASRDAAKKQAVEGQKSGLGDYTQHLIDKAPRW